MNNSASFWRCNLTGLREMTENCQLFPQSQVAGIVDQGVSITMSNKPDLGILLGFS